jgi:hypothetical protein
MSRFGKRTCSHSARVEIPDQQGGSKMMATRFAVTAGTFAGCAALVLAGTLISSPRLQADDDRDGDESKVEIGFEIAPVRLNLHGKNHHLVGLGSYIVNAVGDCNGCHSAGPPTEYIPSGNPYLLHVPKGPFTGKKVVNKTTYLGGGNDFGTLDPDGLSAHIVTRNLTPDRTGLPEGGHTFAEFYQIMRTGVDMDHLHPTCTGALNSGCVPIPFNGKLLQIMPWPAFKDMTDHDLLAIYEYISAVPCIAGPKTGPLHNDCPI